MGAASSADGPGRRPLIGVVAGEVSGDYLGAGLVRALRARLPGARFVGIGGTGMAAEGVECWQSIDALSVMGLTEVLQHLPRLLRLRRDLVRQLLALRPDLVVGIDAPDFNLGLERRLRQRGIVTAHYVSPSVWAWREGRVRGIRRSTDLVLGILPFEEAFYRRHGVPVRYVGHPMADEIPLEPPACDPTPTLALLPGSRRSEVEALGPVFLRTAVWLQERVPGLRIRIPCASPALRTLLEEQCAAIAGLTAVQLHDGDARAVMTSARAVLLASGTAALEAMLLKRPMVVAYRVSPVTAWLARRLLRVPHVSLPNLIADAPLVPEFLQDAVRVDTLGPALLAQFTGATADGALQQRFADIHRRLRLDASAQAAEALIALARLDGRSAS